MSFFGTTNFDLETGLLNVTGYEIFTLNGRTPGMTTAFWPLWAGGASHRVNPTANDTIEIVSTSASDTAAGTGAQAVILVYLDEDYLEIISDPIPLNGTAFVTGPTDFFRLNRILVVASGGGERSRRQTIGAQDRARVSTG